MNKIHLIGSGGFIGSAVRNQAGPIPLHCWSHTSQNVDSYFDLYDSSSWEALLASKPDIAILLSWPGLPNYQQNFHVTRNLPASIQLVECLIDSGIKRIVVAGTCYEYGMQHGPLLESQVPDPVNLYAIAKDSFRRSLSFMCGRENIIWSWLRIFYPFGKGQRSDSFLPAIEDSIELGKSIFPMSSGRQLRDYVSVDFVGSQLLLLATHPKAAGIYNCGSGKPQSLRELAETIVARNNSSIQLGLGLYPDRADEPLAFWADMGKLNQLSII